jgi:hypothetical protein
LKFDILIVRHVVHYRVLLADHPENCRSTAEIHPEPTVPWLLVYFRVAATSDVPVLQAVLTLSADTVEKTVKSSANIQQLTTIRNPKY